MLPLSLQSNVLRPQSGHQIKHLVRLPWWHSTFSSEIRFSMIARESQVFRWLNLSTAPDFRPLGLLWLDVPRWLKMCNWQDEILFCNSSTIIERASCKTNNNPQQLTKSKYITNLCFEMHWDSLWSAFAPVWTAVDKNWKYLVKEVRDTMVSEGNTRFYHSIVLVGTLKDISF